MAEGAPAAAANGRPGRRTPAGGARALARGLVLALAVLAAGPGIVRAQPAPATYVAETVCGECHAVQQRAVAGSQHARAMQPATAATVRGNFDGTTFRKDGVTTRFFRRDGRFFVNTDGPDGKLADFEVRYTFGVEPLQQYLVEFPGGRLQALPIAWDTVRQRWFHVYGSERIDHRDVLHWTRTAGNWNTMCASCHATQVRKNFDAGTRTYRTTTHALGVGCQACHGPASGHLAWARGSRAAGVVGRGFAASLAPGSGRSQVDGCGYCHALRSTLTPEYPPGAPLLDHALPVPLEAPNYFADGQQREEVFVLGSWLQSRMHQKGMVCTDCHDAHSGKLRLAGDALCTSCHNASGPAARPGIDTGGLKRRDYAAATHTHHTKPVACVECHAPKRTYMVVDPRLDHAFRIPRPDLDAETGAPNACNQCHRDRDSRWAASAIARWHGPGRRAEAHYGQAFAAARDGRAGAAEGLQRVATDRTQPAIVRAAAIEALGGLPSRPALAVAVAGLADDDGLVRVAAIRTVAALDPQTSLAELPARLGDPLRAVRIEAAIALAPLLRRLPPDRQAAWEAARQEAEAAAIENADRPQAWLGLAQFALARGDAAAAEKALRTAHEMEPAFIPATLQLADFLRRTGRDAEGLVLLRAAERRVPREASLQEAIALALVRAQKKPEAIETLARARTMTGATTRTDYLYAVALADAGRRREAIAVLDAAARKRGDRDVLLALAAYRSEAGDPAGAKAALGRLAAINPGDPALARGR